MIQMSLESFNNEKIRDVFELACYKHLPKLLLALDELNKPSPMSAIENCFVWHRQSVRYGSLKKTIKKAKELDLVHGEKEFSLTKLGKEKMELLRETLTKME